jgi:hypothetical protein
MGFSIYLSLKIPRTIDQAYAVYKVQRGGEQVAKGHRAPGFFSAWAAGKDSKGKVTHPSAVSWIMRANAWDDHLASLDRQQEAIRWLERRQQLREDEWEIGTQLVERTRRMLQFPLTVIERSEDGKVTVVMPAAWKGSDIPRMAESASKMRRLAADLATDQVQVNDWRVDARAAGIEDPEALLQQVVTSLVAKQIEIIDVEST